MSRITQLLTFLLQRARPGTLSFQRVLLTAIVAGVVVVILSAATQAVLKGNRKQQEAREALRMRDEAKRTLTALQQRKDWLTTSDGIRREGYQHGLAAPGEQVVRLAVPESDEPAATTAPVKPAATTSPIGGLVMMVVVLVSLAFLVGVGLFVLRWLLIRRRRRAVGILTPRSELRHRRRHAAEPLRER